MLSALGLADIPRAHEIRMDGVVVAFSLGLALLLGIVVGAVPALQLSDMNVSVVLREDGRTGTAGRGARYARRALVVAQVALAFVLLIGAGLLLASFRQLLAVDPGFPGRARPDRARLAARRRRIPTRRRFGRTRAARSSGSGRCRASRPPGVSSFLPFGATTAAA